MSAVNVMDGTCWVEVDEQGAVRGVSMPDGTPIPEVMGVDVSAEAGEPQTATVFLRVRVRQDRAQEQPA